MRKLTAVLASLLVVLLGLAAWFYLGGTLRAGVYIQTARAADYPQAYSAIRELLDSGSAPQVLGDEPLPEDPSAYTLADITVTLANRGLFAAEWLHTSVEGVPGDIAVYALTGEGSDIGPRDSGQVNLKLVTTAAPDAVRNITIEYYVYGMKRAITVR